jgi:P4 family phage/plasmid primase-like protien
MKKSCDGPNDEARYSCTTDCKTNQQLSRSDLSSRRASLGVDERKIGSMRPNTKSELISGGPKICDEMNRKFLVGERNTVLTSLAGAMLRRGASRTALTAALIAENSERCEPPLDASEVAKIVESVMRYRKDDLSSVRRFDVAKELMLGVLNNKFGAGTDLIYQHGRFHHYNGKYFEEVDNNWVNGRILEYMDSDPGPGQSEQTTASIMRQVRELLQAKLAVKDDRLRFVADPLPVINCQNGELWIDDDGNVERREHRFDSYLRHCLPVAYDPKAKCPEYDDAVTTFFDDDESLIAFLDELSGYTIQTRRNAPLIAILTGGGANGKTMLATTLTKLMGPSLVQSQRIDEFSSSRFGMGSLCGKLLYLDDDVRSGAKLNDGILKTISEEKQVTGELKYKPQFNFTVRTYPMLLCNNVPSIADISVGMRRRLIVIPFNHTFSEKEQDRELFPWIWENELSGVLNRALRGYKRFVTRGSRFAPPAAVRAATKRFMREAHPVTAFIEEQCTSDADAVCLMQDLYGGYRRWAARAGFTMTQNQLTFRRNLEHLGLRIDHGNKGQQVRGLRVSIETV